MRSQFLSAVTGEGREVLFDLVKRRRVGRDGGVDLGTLAQVMKDCLDGIETEPLGEELDGQRRFVIGELEVHLGFGREEGGAQLAESGEVLAENHLAVTRSHCLAPCGIGLEFLIDRDAFAQPAGHLVARELQRDHVTEFVPEHGLPIGRVARLGEGAVGGDDAAETHSEVTWIAGHTESAHAEVLGLWENLHDRRRAQLQAVLGAQVGFGALQQGQHTLAVNHRFICGHADDKVAVGQRGELRHVLLESNQVKGGHVVGVGGVHLVGELPPFVLLAKTQQVHRELDFGRKESRIELQGPALASLSLGKAILLRELPADEMVHCRVRFPIEQGGFAGARFRLGIVSQMCQHRPIGPGLGMVRVHQKRSLQGIFRRGVFLAIDQVIGQQQIAGNVIGVLVQSRFEGTQHLTAVARGVGLGEAEKKIRVIRKLLQSLGKHFCRQRVIILGQSQVSACQIGLPTGRVALFGQIEELFEHAPRVCAQQQRCPAHRHQAWGILVSPHAVAAQVVDLAEQAGSLVDLAVLAEDFVS